LSPEEGITPQEEKLAECGGGGVEAVDYFNVKLVDELVVIILFTFNFWVRCKTLTL
jgi:hypothetical protein